MKIRTALVTTALFLFTACASSGNSGTTGAAAMNTKCPMSGEQLDADCPTTSVDGKTIGFCCNNCLTKFEGMSAADQKAKVGSTPMR